MRKIYLDLMKTRALLKRTGQWRRRRNSDETSMGWSGERKHLFGHTMALHNMILQSGEGMSFGVYITSSSCLISHWCKLQIHIYIRCTLPHLDAQFRASGLDSCHLLLTLNTCANVQMLDKCLLNWMKKVSLFSICFCRWTIVLY